VRDPSRFTKFSLAMFAEDFRLVNAFLDRPDRLPSEYTTKVAVASLGAEQARTVLRGTGIEVAETIDINDAKAFDTIRSKLAGVTATDVIYSAGEVSPGDKVALLVQDGVARGYVLLERGTGKLPFERATVAGVVSEADKTLADRLIRDVAAARDDIAVLSRTREALVTGIGSLREEVTALAQERDNTANSLAAVRGELDVLVQTRETLVTGIGGLRDEIATVARERDDTAGSLTAVRGELEVLARTRETLTGQIETARADLQSAEDSRRTLLESLRNAQPVNVVLGNNADVIAKLAGEGITTVADIARLTPTVMKRLERAGVQTEAQLTELRKKATDFLRRE
jgi:cell division protein FtsB